MKFLSNRLLTWLVIATVSSALPLRDLGHQMIVENDYTFRDAIRDTLKDSQIIGDVLDDFTPDYYIDITYPKHHESVRLGNDIPVPFVSHRPVFTFQPLSTAASPAVETNNATFTLILTDPDAKSREDPKWSEMCHWIVTNLSLPLIDPSPNFGVLDSQETLGKKSGELEEYLPPGPPPKTGPHRYVFVLLQGDSSSLTAPADRQHWGYGKVRHGVRDWADQNDLTVVGANFFYAQNKKQ
ncbi:hypothetical protein PV10_01533 [Exophiala mesophila]|uniref:Phosphatidylethanolamine-binding protein n=1 Tax=Exophiala mesophila TaxID=212818 RepID=A0A0D2AFX9_EXOME|nr:uncharacterized protein PV10_01533 [Exophiala mesophila]KIV97828.1 hypothetical protein PV10_01533 [Exophiala mesophila]